MRLVLAAALSALTIAGCATQPGEPTSTTSSGIGTVELTDTDNGVVGEYTHTDGAVVTFTSTELEPKVYEVVWQLDGMTLEVLVDNNKGIISFDGYTTADGSDTQMRDADRNLLAAVAHALDQYGTDVAEPLALARRMASNYSEHPEGLSLQRIAYAEQQRDWTSICWALNSYQQTSHDCNVGGWWTDATTIDHAYVSMHGSCGAADGTNFYKNGAWKCYEPDHDTSVEYGYGNCYGRCGGGCGSDTQFTWDCLDHDTCVRTGHSLASLYCDDEFTAASDDWASAPNC